MSPDKPVMAASRWPTNADLIADVARLGYLKDDDRILDPTYGRGTWWKRWQPNGGGTLVTNDLDPTSNAKYHDDFRKLEFTDGYFDVVAFDPPYVSVGGRRTSGMKEFQDRYGMDDAPKTPMGVQQQANEGLAEMHRVVKRRGIVLVKSQDYVSGGKLWIGTFYTQMEALRLGFATVDRLEHIGSPRPQPPGRRQMHARRNLSTLFVFQKQ